MVKNNRPSWGMIHGENKDDLLCSFCNVVIYILYKI